MITLGLIFACGHPPGPTVPPAWQGIAVLIVLAITGLIDLAVWLTRRRRAPH
jgi:hypothetical protein